MIPSSSGQLFIIAAPSGGGKTSLVHHLVNTLDNIEISISHTTRDKRQGEIHGVHYFFVSKAVFLDMVHQGQFIEHAVVFDHDYGTSIAQIENRLSRGIDVLLDIDWQGAQQIRCRFKTAVSIFILPPSLQVLHQRLEERGREDVQLIQKRMAMAQEEMRHFNEFDYLIINDDFKKALSELQATIVAARLKLSIQMIRHQALLKKLSCCETR